MLSASSYERARPIFDRSRRRFHPIVAIKGVRAAERQLVLDLETRAGARAHAIVTFPAPGVLRLRRAWGRMPGEHLTEMLAAPPDSLPLRIAENEDRIVVEADGHAAVIYRRPWRLEFGPFRTEPHDASIVEWVNEPGGWAVEGDATKAYETFALAPGEELYGLGERFAGPALRGRRLAHWIDQPFGTNTTDRVHKSVPLVVSTRGYGLFFHHPEEATFDLGAVSTASASVLVESAELDLFVMLGSPKEVLRRYTALTGRPSVPPDWSFGVWMSRCMYRNRAEVEDVVETARELDVPVDVVNLDPDWLATRYLMPPSVCDFVWNEEDFGPLPDLVSWLRDRDVRLCLWLNPSVHEDSPRFDPSVLVDGGAARDRDYPVRTFVDFTGAGADWWREEIGPLLAAGVDALKLDFGETLPSDARMADGRRGAEVHNLYPLLYTRVASEAGAPVCFTRAATAGSQRYPLHWAGDTPSTWSGMMGALRGGLAAAWSGIAHWTSDIGGFYHRDLYRADEPGLGFGPPDETLYIRWMQFGMLCSHTRFHGNSPREPWHFGPRAVDITRRFAELRARLRGYLLECAQEASSTGCPVMRPLALEFPDDPGARHVDTEYLLGPGLLVAPVLTPDDAAEVYLPPGGWTDAFTRERVEGPRWISLKGIPLDRMPLWVREGYDPLPSR